MTTTIAESLLHFLWQGTGLGLLAYMVLRRVGDNPATRYAVGVGTLAAMALAPVVTSLWLLSETVAPIAAVPGVIHAPGGSTLPVAWVLGLWACGVTTCAVRLVGGWVVARRMTTRAVQPVAHEIQALATQVAARLSVTTPFRVLESTIAASPMLIGWLRPVVLLPTATLAGLSPAQLEALLAHEFAHMRRHDYLVNLLQSVVETLLFYHPAVWLVSRSVRESREQCCDDLTVSVCDRLTYVSALSSVAALRTSSPALAAGGGALRYRVERLLRPQSTASFSMGWLGVIPVALVIAAAMPIASTSQVTTPPVAAPAQSVTSPAPISVPQPTVLETKVATTTVAASPAPTPTSMRPALPVVLDFLMPTTQAMVMPEPPPLIAPQAPARRVAAGDTITLDFYGLVSSDEEMRKRYVVRPDGAIEVKHLGLVMVAGKTLREAAAAVLGSLEPNFYPAGFVQVVALPADAAVGAQAPKQEEVLNRVVVQGQVLESGERVLRGTQMKVSRAIAAAGGFTAMAGQDIEIRRLVDGKAVTIKVTRGQLDSGDDPPLQADDIVTVRTGQVFFVTGEVNTGGQKIWAPGMTVGKAISMSNGMTPKGKLGHIQRAVKGADGKVLRFEKVQILKTDTEVLPDDTLVINRKWFGN